MPKSPSALRLPVVFPAALLPALALFLTLASAASGASGLALLRLLHRHAQQAGAQVSKLSRDLSRHLSDRFLASIQEPGVLRPRNVVGSGLLLLALESARRMRSALKDSLALLYPAEESLDRALAESRQAVIFGPKWGHGLPRPPKPGEWRPYLHSLKTAQENLQEIRGALGLLSRRPEEMTLDQITEGVRVVLIQKYSAVLKATKRFWSQQQAEGIAKALALDCGLPEPLPRGGLEEIAPRHLVDQVPWKTPRWLQWSQRMSIALLRPVFLHAWSWDSRYVQTPSGPMHVYDAKPSGGQSEEPPLLLQHGMFVTGWSMALLGWLLCRRGRRVIIPDLFDFDHGLSTSSSASSGGEKVRRTPASVEALMCVIRDILQDSGSQQLDLCGHSFGGWLTSAVARRCDLEGVPVRKVVLLGPGGPYNFLNHSPAMARFLCAPMETIDEIGPWWIPPFLLKAVARCGMGVLLSPNNSNFIIGQKYSDYLGHGGIGSQRPTLLLWGDQDKIAAPRRPEPLGAFLRERFPRLEAFWVARGGHNIQLDSAVAVARTVDAWLRAGDGGDGGGVIEKLLFPLDTSLRPMEFARSEEVQTASPRAKL